MYDSLSGFSAFVSCDKYSAHTLEELFSLCVCDYYCVNCSFTVYFMFSCGRQEERGKSSSGSDEDEEQEICESGELPGYISVLFTAHDFLGR
jgi:hypothetical protein